MILNYNVTGNDRKALVNIIGEALGEKPKYMGMPSAAYQIGGFMVSKTGELSFDNDIDAAAVLTAIAQAGYQAETDEPEADVPAETEDTGHEETEETTETDASTDGLTIEMPRDFFTEAALDNLQKLIDSKVTLIKKALSTDALPVQVTDEKVSFPWFTQADPEAVAAYTKFISALCKMAKEATRVTATDKPVGNEKYAFRCFLLRLGFIGSEYKADRKVLLKNLTGSSAFRRGQKGGSDEISE